MWRIASGAKTTQPGTTIVMADARAAASTRPLAASEPAVAPLGVVNPFAPLFPLVSPFWAQGLTGGCVECVSRALECVHSKTTRSSPQTRSPFAWHHFPSLRSVLVPCFRASLPSSTRSTFAASFRLKASIPYRTALPSRRPVLSTKPYATSRKTKETLNLDYTFVENALLTLPRRRGRPRRHRPSAQTAYIYNYCNAPINLWAVDAQRNPQSPTPIANGSSYSEGYHTLATGGVSLKLGWGSSLYDGSPITQFEYTLTGGFIWYDISSTSTATPDACPFANTGTCTSRRRTRLCLARTCSAGEVPCSGAYTVYNDDWNSLACGPSSDIRSCTSARRAPPRPPRPPRPAACPPPRHRPPRPPRPPPARPYVREDGAIMGRKLAARDDELRGSAPAHAPPHALALERVATTPRQCLPHLSVSRHRH